MKIDKKALYSLLLASLPVIKLILQLYGITIPHLDDAIIAIAGGTGAVSLAGSGPVAKSS